MLEDFRFKVFVTVADRKSFTKAAAQLRISQPAVSQNITELEKQLGAKFFDRMRGEVRLTPAGEVFREYAEAVLAQYDEISGLFELFDDVVVKIAAPEGIFDHIVSVLLRKFVKVHPEVSFVMTLVDDEADVKVTLSPVENERGMMALSYHPSSGFASTRLWNLLSEFLEPALK